MHNNCIMRTIPISNELCLLLMIIVLDIDYFI